MSAASGVGLGHQSALLSIQSVAASCDSSFPILCNAGAFELTLLLLGQCGRRKCQKCYCDDPEHRASLYIYAKNTTNGCSCRAVQIRPLGVHRAVNLAQLGFRSGHTSRRERNPAGAVAQFGVLEPALVSGKVQS